MTCRFLYICEYTSVYILTLWQPWLILKHNNWRKSLVTAKLLVVQCLAYGHHELVIEIRLLSIRSHRRWEQTEEEEKEEEDAPPLQLHTWLRKRTTLMSDLSAFWWEHGIAQGCILLWPLACNELPFQLRRCAAAHDPWTSSTVRTKLSARVCSLICRLKEVSHCRLRLRLRCIAPKFSEQSVAVV